MTGAEQRVMEKAEHILGEIPLDGVDWQMFRNHLLRASHIMAEMMRSLYEALVSFSQAFSDFLWKAYREAGMPYGESFEGLQRWLCEVGRIAELRREADELELYHKQMAELRRVMRETDTN